MAVQINGQEVGPIKFTDNLAGKTVHIGQSSPVNPVDGDIWIDADALNNAGKNLIQIIDLTTGGSSKSCTVSSDYKDVYIVIRGLDINANASMTVRVNGDSTSSYSDSAGVSQTALFTLDGIKAGVTSNLVKISIEDAVNSSTSKVGRLEAVYTGSATNVPRMFLGWSSYIPTAALTSIVLTLSTGSFAGGTVLVYGVN